MTWGENQQDQNVVLRLCIVYVLVDQICWSFPVDHCEIGYKNENDDDDNIAATDDAFEITSKWRIHSINQENLWSPFFIFLQKTIHESSYLHIHHNNFFKERLLMKASNFQLWKLIIYFIVK